MGIDVGDVFDVVKDTADFVGVGGGGGLSGLQDGLIGERFLKELFKVLGEAAPVLTSAFGEGLADVSPQVAAALKDVFSTIADVLTGALKQVNTFPAPFVEGPLDAFKSLREVGSFGQRLIVDRTRDVAEDAVTAFDRLKDRVDVINNSLAQLFGLLAGGNELGADVIFRNLLNSFTDNLLRVLDPAGGSIEDVIAESIKDIVFPTEIVEAVFKAAVERKFWAFISLPRGLVGGQLNDWLNDENLFEPVRADRPWRRSLEREYRCRMVHALDSYLRQRAQTELKDPVSIADRRMSFEMLSDMIGVFIETTIFFAFEPDCLPRLDFEMERFDDIGVQFGSFAAKQLKIPIRGTIGLLLRGLSFWSFNNDVLIEFLGTLISTFISAVIEASLRNIAWSLTIVGCYPNFPNTAPGVLDQWESLETIENTNLPADRLKYVVMLRRPEFDDPLNSVMTLNGFPAIQRLVRDVGAYIDVGYQQFKIGSVFLADLATDVVRIHRAEWDGGTITIEATIDNWSTTPQPILRAYFCCHAMAMRPDADTGGPYRISVECDFLPRNPTVTVLSNHGGIAERLIAIIQ